MKSCPYKIAALLFYSVLLLASSLALATPVPSKNVVIIGGTTLVCGGSSANLVISGGCLPVTGTVGELGDFTFAAMAPAAVSTASLTNYDTAVLNVASPGIACNMGNLTASAKTDLVAFVSSGRKLIIYDSECPPQDYSWLPYKFTTSNPGQMGARGTLTVVENNTLSTWVGDPTCTGLGAADPYCINVAFLGSNTDAVGDMNVMTTFDPYWSLDMSGTNVLNVTGPVHTYAKYPAGTDRGLFIYNGLDMDYLSGFPGGGTGSDILRKIWTQELHQVFNPSGLPDTVPVVGIKLTPATAQNEVGTADTVTAKLTDLLNNPQPGIQVTFSVTSGPNAGAKGTCSTNADCTTDSNGEVSFTYTGVAGVGTDELNACFKNQAGTQICSQSVTAEWIITNKPPACSDATPSVSLIWSISHEFVPINILGVTDPDGDTVTIKVTSIYQDEAVNAKGSGNTAPDGQGVGTSTAQVRAERVGDPNASDIPGNGRVYHIHFTADDGKGGSCTGEVRVGVPHDQGQGATPIDDGEIYDSTIVPQH